MYKSNSRNLGPVFTERCYQMFCHGS
jgi:hypothetical protein